MLYLDPQTPFSSVTSRYLTRGNSKYSQAYTPSYLVVADAVHAYICTSSMFYGIILSPMAVTGIFSSLWSFALPLCSLRSSFCGVFCYVYYRVYVVLSGVSLLEILFFSGHG